MLENMSYNYRTQSIQFIKPKLKGSFYHNLAVVTWETDPMIQCLEAEARQIQKRIKVQLFTPQGNEPVNK